MGRYQALRVAAFAFLLITFGCKKTVPILVTGEQLDGAVITSDRDTLKFQDVSNTGIHVTFPSDADKYPPACADTKEFTICPGNFQTCQVNPNISKGPVYYKIDPGGECPVLPGPPPAPIPYSVVHCKNC
jgi:hypothetical protein